MHCRNAVKNKEKTKKKYHNKGWQSRRTKSAAMKEKKSNVIADWMATVFENLTVKTGGLCEFNNKNRWFS